jgi:RHS repeat-associated protein
MMKKALIAFVLALGFASGGFAQTATGIYPYSTYGGGPFDAVNLGPLNVHFQIPVTVKAGRGTPFSYTLTYDSLIWSTVTSNGVTSWQPDGNMGWGVQTQPATGYVTYGVAHRSCNLGTSQHPIIIYYNLYTFRSYRDILGATHPINASVVDNTLCPAASGYQTSMTGIATTDGSGYKFDVNSTPSATVHPRTGGATTPPLNSSSGNGAFTDTNGNQISISSGSNTTFTDTLGATALTISGTAPNPVTLIYTSPVGSASFTINYTSTQNIQTNFGCSSIGEYSGSANLISSIVLPDNTSYSFTYEPTPSNSGSVTGRIASVTLPTGGTISYSYTGSNNGIICGDGSTAGLTRTLSGNIDNAGTFQYARAGTAPSSTTTVTDPLGQSSSVFNFQEVTDTASSLNFYYETQRQLYDGSSSNGTSLRQSAQTCYNGAASPCTSTAITLPISRRTVYTSVYDQSGINPVQAERDTFYNAAGLVTESDEYDFGNANSGPGTLSRKTLVTYTSPGNNMVRPSTLTVQDGNSNPFSQIAYSYDETALAATSGAPQHDYTNFSTSFTQRGNPTTVQQWVSGTTFIATTNTYDDLGNLRTTSDAGGHQTTLDYTDSYNDGLNHNTQAFATTVTMPVTSINNVSHVVKSKFYWPSAMLYQSIGQSGQTITYHYDNMWRTTEVDLPDGGETTVTYTAFQSGSFASVETNRLVDTSGNFAHSFVEFDGFGRPDRTAFFNTTNFDQVDTCYNASGQVSWVSYAYLGQGWGGHPKVCNGPNGPFGDSFSYDALGRQTSVTHSDLTTVITSYSGRAVEVQDEGNGSGTRVTHVYQQDGLGRTTSVCELAASIFNIVSMTTCGNFDLAGGANGITTSYVYDALDRVTQVSQGALTARQLAYDGLSHVIGEIIPEVNNKACTVSDGNSYSVCYNYDSEGKLIARVRPRPNQAAGGTALTTTSYSYDELHRLRIVNYNDDATENTPARVFFYDPTGAFGQMSAAISENHALNVGYTFDNLGYDSMGRVTSDQQTVAVPSPSWVQKTFTYNYNLLGEPLTANFSNFSLTNTYNSAARLTQVQSSLNDATHPPTLFSNPQYNQFGELTSDALGNGVNETFGYDLRGREISVSAVKGMSTVYSLGGPGTGNTMTYTPNSGLSAANDSVNGNWSYGYDALSRIASASKSGGASLSFDIDRNANRWHQNPSGQGAQLSFDSSTNHVASGNGVTYDAAGNVINDGTHSYTYDAEYRITKVDGGTTATYLYDAFGRRAQRVVGPNTYDELYDLGGNVVVELTPSGAAAGYEVFMGGRHLATYSSNLTFFAHTDWLGTERVRTDPGGNVAVSCISNPYGDNQVCTGNDQSRIHYAGMEYDSESSLYHTLFRYYNPRLGLWMTPDPAGMGATNLADPQSLNRSAYVGNSPINSLDPLGRSYAKVDEPTPQIDPFALLNAYFSWYNNLFIPGSNGLPANTSDYDFNAIDSALVSALAASGGGVSLSGGGGALSGETLGFPSGLGIPPVGLGSILGGVLGVPNTDPLCDFVPNCGTQPVAGFSSGGGAAAAGAIGGTIICQLAEPCGVVEDIGLILIGVGALLDSITQSNDNTIGRCQKVRQDCLDKCWEQVQPMKVPSSDKPGLLRKCMRKCMTDNGCPNF